MTSRAEKARKKKAAILARTAENKAAKARGEAPRPTAPKPRKPIDRKGLDWLRSKGRISDEQFWAGTEYGNLYRRVAMSGVEPIRSNINLEIMGSGDGTPGFPKAERDLDAQDRLNACHEDALQSHAKMIATCAAICGRQLTPREITTDHSETVQIESTLQTALDLLIKHFKRQHLAV